MSSYTPTVKGWVIHPLQSSLTWLLITLMLLSQVLTTARMTTLPVHPAVPAPIWGQKPVLAYFVFTASLAERLPKEAGLSETQFQTVEQVAQHEADALRTLEQESLAVVQNPGLSLEQKRLHIAEMSYNQRIRQVLRASKAELIAALGPFASVRLSRWIERQWQVERSLHGVPLKGSGPRTYRVFATRYDSNGAYAVALPDKCLKFANGGNHVCDSDGYVAGAGYTVFISYQGSTAVQVRESGPWNVDDNYWATSADPTPRRKFADLPLGMPEAQAAYFNGYNGGVDQFGREVTAPFGIDLAREVSKDIGLEPGKNDWIDVSFMWTEGWDGSTSSKSKKSGGTAQANPPQATIIPIKIAKPKADGSVVHVVQEGQTLWNIAAAYQVKLGEILTLNGLSDGALIYPGEKLLIKPASKTRTPTSSSTAAEASPTRAPTSTPRPKRTPTQRAATEIAQAIPSAGPEATLMPTDLSMDELSPGMDPFLMIIGGLALAGAVLFLVGQTLSHRS